MKEYIIKIGDEPDIMGNYPLTEKAKELVRCKDCKSRNGSECQNDDLLRQIHDCGCGATFHTDDDWFCPYGKRKDGDGK